MRFIQIVLCVALTLPVAVWAQRPSTSGNVDSPASIPLTVVRNPRFGTYSAKIVVGIGNLSPLPFGFDTGSSGLHVFADAGLDAPNSGAQCTKIPTSVTYGNPARITYNGVVCYAQLHFAGLSTPATVPVAYLTSASCPPTNPDCRIPDVRSVKAMHGYGVFGAGLTGVMRGAGSVPNPFLTLPGRRGETFTIALRRGGGEVVLGESEPADSAEFALRPGTRIGERYSFAQTCLFVDGRATGACLLISFDTGNGVPWIHDDGTIGVPQRDGFVRAGTRLGFAPPQSGSPATVVVAGTSFDDGIKVVQIPNRAPLANTSIQAFFDRVVTYDDVRGVIAFADAR